MTSEEHRARAAELRKEATEAMREWPLYTADALLLAQDLRDQAQIHEQMAAAAEVIRDRARKLAGLQSDDG
jgi:hypothetical protein